MLTSRISLAATALFVAASALACSHGPSVPKCPSSSTRMSAAWKSETMKFAGASLMIPEGAVHRDIPRDEGTIGEAWGNGDWNIYYKRDSAHTSHVIEPGPNVHDLLVCTDTISGQDVDVAVLQSTSNTAPGAFAQGTWMFPGHGSLYLVVLGPAGTSRDSMLAVLRSVHITEKP